MIDFFDTADETAEGMFQKINEAMEKCNLPYEKLSGTVAFVIFINCEFIC